MNRLFELKHINLSLSKVQVLNDIDWSVDALQSWAILGNNGAGKSTLLRLILGEIWPDQNFSNETPSSEISWYIAGKKETSPIAIKNVVASVSPELHTWYINHGWNLTGEELLLSGLYASPLLYGTPIAEEQADVRALAEELGLIHLLEYQVAEMSQGQLRNMLVARALVASPILLGLDEVFEGLDSAARNNLFQLLEHLSQFESTIIMAAHRPEDLPSFIKNAVQLEQGTIKFKGPIKELNIKQLTKSSLPNLGTPPIDFSNPPLLEMKNINVFIERNHVLHDLNWTLEKGENWAILGENGSGKTTLLRCLWGDIHYALGGTLAWFGKPGPHNLSGLHQKLGLVSDQLQASIPPKLLAKDLVISGFYASIDLYDKPDNLKISAALKLMEEMELLHLIDKQAGTLSYGQLRRILLCRALVHEPILLLLDEPCSGLDNNSRHAFLESLAHAVHKGKTQVIHVTHRTDDLAGITTHSLYLDRGRLSYCGKYPKPD